MICPQCHGPVDEKATTCRHCSRPLMSDLRCVRCGQTNRPRSLFCDHCGTLLDREAVPDAAVVKSERKHVTVLFSDISGYRKLIHIVDAEVIRDVTHRLFAEVVRIISRYDGYVDRVLWDGLLAVFGMPRSHEDDAVRAIRAAMEIRHHIFLSANRLAAPIGEALAMRTGIATGLVVTGAVDETTGRHGITGETVNLAARLRDLAAPNEILANSRAFSAAAGFFSFQALPPVSVKGRKRPVLAYQVRSASSQPDKVRRVNGLKARLIGRDREMGRLRDAARRLRRREGTVLTVCGDAGTGKSRLISEFKEAYGPTDIRWLDGYAYAFNQGIPYYPFIDLLNRLFAIQESDGDAIIQDKLLSGLTPLLDDPDAVVPFLAALYALSPVDHLAAGPENFKSRPQQAFIRLFTALAHHEPTILCIEDLHWADPSSLALMRFILNASGLPILFIISFRPAINFPEDDDGAPVRYPCEHIRLSDLDPPASREMVCSLMDTQTIPEALERYILNHVEGNPFYLEEVVNSLIDADCLKRVDQWWVLDDAVELADISSTINGIIHGRLDRLGPTAKAVLQEAAVLGRVFRLDLLKRITTFPQRMEACLDRIEQVDLIRRLPDPGGPTYSFKHAIVQEVVYRGLLKKERRVIHEKVARALETVYHSRLDSILETVALHYANSDCVVKAAAYLIRSGEKSLQKYAVEESHRYYQEAYRMLCRLKSPSEAEQAMLIDLLIKWYFVFNKRGLFREMLDLLRRHEDFVMAFGDPRRTGMYRVCLGWALQRREMLDASFDYLMQALATGRELEDDALIAYSCACLCWTCTDLGRMDAALAYGRQAADVADRLPVDYELIRFNLTGIGLLHFFSGDVRACWETGKELLRFGDAVGDIRTFSEGYLLMGSARMAAGDFAQAEDLLGQAIAVAVEPIYSLNARFFLSYAYFSQGKVAIAAKTLEAVIAATEKYGYEYVGTSANAFYGIVTAAMGHLDEGVRLIREQIRRHCQHGKRNHELIFTHMLGKFYLSLVRRQTPLNLKATIKNAPFLLRSLPLSARYAERYLCRAIAIGTRIGARLRLAQAHLDLGRLYLFRKRIDDARRHVAESIALFEACGAEPLLSEARETLDQLSR